MENGHLGRDILLLLLIWQLIESIQLWRLIRKYEQLALPDHPEGYFNLGRLYTVMKQPNLAERAYQTAIERDNNFFPAHTNLANFYYQAGRKKEAEKIFRQALESTTNQGILYYSLGLLLAEQERLEEAADNLARAAALMPDRPRVHYNYGLLLQQLGQNSKAEFALLKANQLSPYDSEILYALITFYMQQQQWDQARVYAEQLIQFYPDVPEFQELLDSLPKR